MMKGYALLVGVNEVNHQSYNNNKWELPSALNDTTQLHNLLNDIEGYVKIGQLNHSSANWLNVVTQLEILRNEINGEESYFFFFFSGHATPIKLDDGTTKEFLCFYDELVSENEVQEQVSLFSEKTKLFIIINSCFSRGIINPLIIINKIHFSFSLEKPQQEYPGFQSVYDSNKEKYNSKLQLYKNKQFNSDTDILFYFASNEFEMTDAGQGNGNLNPFTKYFIRNWEHKKSKKTYNYYSLFRTLSLRTKNQAEILSLNKSNNHLFSTTFPLIFKNNNMNSPIQTYENLNQYVSFYFDESVEEHRMLHSITFEINANDRLHKELISRVESFNDPTLLVDVGVMSLIFVELVDTTGQTNLPHPIRGLKTLAGSTKYGIILTVDDNFNLLHKPKRTTGKVSNKLGGI